MKISAHMMKLTVNKFFKFKSMPFSCQRFSLFIGFTSNQPKLFKCTNIKYLTNNFETPAGCFDNVLQKIISRVSRKLQGNVLINTFIF